MHCHFNVVNAHILLVNFLPLLKTNLQKSTSFLKSVHSTDLCGTWLDAKTIWVSQSESFFPIFFPPVPFWKESTKMDCGGGGGHRASDLLLTAEEVSSYLH